MCRTALLFALAIASLAALRADEPLSLPVVLQPDRELNELFGYKPEYTPNVPTFDSRNRPYIRSRGLDIHETSFIQTLRGGEWKQIDFTPALRKAFPGFKRVVLGGGTRDVRVIFDRQDRFYTILGVRLEKGETKTVMLYSADFGETIGVVEIPPGAVPAEHVSGHNELEGPPFLMIAERLADHPGRWASRNRLLVTQPKWREDAVVVPEPVEVSRMLVSLGQHSGGSSFAVTREGKTHFVWAEVTEDEDAPGSPTFAATYDQQSGKISSPRFIAHAPPLNNSHNVPGIVIDSDGLLHVVTGAHYGESFFYVRSLEANDTSAWTDLEPVLASGWTAASGRDAGGQTYVSLVCDPENTLHLVFRHWQRGIANYPHLADGELDQLAALSYQRKPAGAEEWSEPTTLVIPERGVYSIYYQKLSLDRIGGLFLSLSYTDRVLLDRSGDERFHRRMVLFSPDAGSTWRFATTADFAR